MNNPFPNFISNDVTGKSIGNVVLLCYLFACIDQFGRKLPSDPTVSIRMNDILSLRNKFKIRKTIVGLITVLMVDLITLRNITHESYPNKTVDVIGMVPVRNPHVAGSILITDPFTVAVNFPVLSDFVLRVINETTQNFVRIRNRHYINLNIKC
jgi:hypothetical protein